MSTPLIEANELAEALTTARPPTVLDVRWRLSGRPGGREEYEAGHVPGAVFLDLDRDVCGPPGANGRHPLPHPAALQGALQAAGIGTWDSIVLYDGGDGMSAARAWWTLRWAGIEQVRVLNGGLPAWLAAGGALDTGIPRVRRGDVTVRPGSMPVLDAEGAAELARTGVLLDARAPQRYRGEVEPVDPVAGHIPGARNLPYAALVNADGTLREDLAQVVRDSLGDAEGPIGAYCGSGVTAAHTVLALHVAGHPDAALYAGSWSHWITDPDRPVATGAEPAPDGPAPDGEAAR